MGMTINGCTTVHQQLIGLIARKYGRKDVNYITMSTGFYAKWLASRCNLLSLLLAGKLLSTLSNFNLIDTHSELRIMQAAPLISIAVLLTMDICPFALASKHCSSLWKPFTTAATRKTQSGGKRNDLLCSESTLSTEVVCASACYFKSSKKMTNDKGAQFCKSHRTNMLYLKSDAENVRFAYDP